MENDFLKGTRFLVRKQAFAIVKSDKLLPNSFATIQDGKEITCVVEESEFDCRNVVECEKGFRLFSFDGVLPFSLVGFIARVSSALAGEGVSIFVVSAFSTDHFLVKEKDFEKAVKALEQLDCVIELEK
ncbi:ACT domain-containing protein [Candidatus Micrarchaeota archaeon]|nr:ACT domain-containing protein [Candidatus Micrarchaeota archaeon]